MISPIDSATESLLEALFSDPPAPIPCENAESGLGRVGTAVVGAADGAIVSGAADGAIVFGAAVGPLVGSLTPPGILPEPLPELLPGSSLVVPLDVDGIPVTGEAVGTAAVSSIITGRSMIGADVVGANVVDGGEDMMYAPLSMILEWSTSWV
mmetsp:Transcript_6036/g.11115  ORF Transcript_6036/g.11115 Transcript_6036/m.11115 type:complete len:153 (-) Transcript_6036:1333-1791(-)